MKLTKQIVRKVLEIVDRGLCKGQGIQEPGKMCVEAAVCFALGLPHGDNPPCVGAAVREFKIALNDSAWSSDKARAKGLRRLAIAQLGSDSLNQTEFILKLQVATIKGIVPRALRHAVKVSLDKTHKEAMEAAAVQCEEQGSECAARAAGDAAWAAWAARDAAWAARDAARAAGDAARAARAAGAAWAARAAGDAARAAGAAGDKELSFSAELCVQVLVEMKSPGTRWLDLTE